MNVPVVLDADFLSAFLKIEQLSMVRELYQVEELHLPPAVYREIAITDLLTRLLDHSWIKVQSPQTTHMQLLRGDTASTRLGRGELEAIALAMEYPDSVLLMNDNRARRLAVAHGIMTVNIPTFLLACRLVGLLDRQAMTQVVADLQEKDYYGFRQDVMDLLLS